ncbi:MAG: bifunctional nuclease family protein [Chloroflexota bacterium]
MIEVTIDSIRVSLMSHHRIVVLKEEDGERLLPIWIGPFEADAITIQLQGMDATRPLTHDLLKTIIETLGAEVLNIVVTGLETATFYAKIVMDLDGDTIEIDSRPSDAIALAVRVNAPIYVAEDVMDQASIEPGEEMSLNDPQNEFTESDEPGGEDIGVFKDLIEGLDLDDPLGSTNP